MLERGDACVVALSGGPDSMCMLDVLAQMELTLFLARFAQRLELHAVSTATDGPCSPSRSVSSSSSTLPRAGKTAPPALFQS